METINDPILDDLLGPPGGGEIDPDHRAWINEQVRERLAKIESGEMKFKTLQEVRRKFGFDAY